MIDTTLLQSLLPDGHLRCFDETVSTNRDARDWLLNGAQHGDLVIASRQSGGRGRLGRSFSSPEGGLYMSLILKCDLAPGAITTLCAVSVRRAILQLTGLDTDIKWVNDLLLQGKKVCGILCENVWCGTESLGAIAGIGVNVYGNDFPAELQDIARALYPDHTQPPISMEALAAAICREILDGLHNIPAHMNEYRRHCITLGKDVAWLDNGKQRYGKALTADDSGSLAVRDEDGTMRLIAFGEVSIRTI